MLQFIQIVFERLIGAFDLGRLGEIERQNDGGLFLRQGLSHPVFVAVAKQDRFQLKFVRDPQSAEQIELILRLEGSRIALRLLGQRREAALVSAALLLGFLRYALRSLDHMLEITLPTQGDVPMSEFG